MVLVRQFFYLLIFAVCFTGFLSPPVALTIGILFGLLLETPFPDQSRVAARLLLQFSVVALGFGMNLHEVLKAGRSGFVYTAVGIAIGFAIGLVLARWLVIGGHCGYLITAGTAICGGSAIAAVGPILCADAEEMAVSLGAVFALNSVALLIFPPLGHWLKLTQTQFGLWAALAIHDTSSVVGAASRYGAEALLIGTTVKLARALWIVPLALATAAIKRSKTKIVFPWFILFFSLASLLNTLVPGLARYCHGLFQAGRLGLTATLFLIGSGISRETLRQVGWRPMALAIVLWIVVGTLSLLGIQRGWIAL
jgi:uncharacterized integral membrane protein (TIGR00698 family)